MTSSLEDVSLEETIKFCKEMIEMIESGAMKNLHDKVKLFEMETALKILMEKVKDNDAVKRSYNVCENMFELNKTLTSEGFKFINLKIATLALIEKIEEHSKTKQGDSI